MEVTNATLVITDPCYLMPDCPVISDYNFDFQKDISEFTLDEQKEYERYSADLETYHKRIQERDDWELCKYGMEMEILGFQNYLTCPTELRWCWLVKDNNGKVLGQFSADSDIVGVFLIDEIIKYDKSLLERFSKIPQCVCIIKDFTGNVIIKRHRDKNKSITIIGKGNINFKSEVVE
jgi:hypothetical protein